MFIYICTYLDTPTCRFCVKLKHSYLVLDWCPYFRPSFIQTHARDIRLMSNKKCRNFFGVSHNTRHQLTQSEPSIAYRRQSKYESRA